MKLTPRKDEYAVVTEILEDPSFKNADAMAKAVVKAVAEALGQREWWFYAWRDGDTGPVLTWGPFASEKDVEAFAQKVGLKGESRAMQLFSPGALLDRMEKDDVGVLRYCGSCKHPIGAHQHPKQSGICAVRGCSCKILTKATKEDA